MLIAILGRQPALSLAELESYFGKDKLLAHDQFCAIINQTQANINHLGGCLKLAQVDFELKSCNFNSIASRLKNYYIQKLPSQAQGKITLGISCYGLDIQLRQIKDLGLSLKFQLPSVRLVPNQTLALSTATVYHNKLSSSPKKVELIITNINGITYVGRSIGVQDINAYVNRDRKRPKRDARVGMLPPKLAQILVNLSRPQPYHLQPHWRLLDPFCGTGVILQEASLMGFGISGSDLEPRMIDYTKINLEWLNANLKPSLSVGNARTHRWQPDFDCVASETYLGYPFKSIQSSRIINQEASKIESLLSTFLLNLRSQIQPATRVCIAIPAWLEHNESYRDLALSQPLNLKRLGYEKIKFKSVNQQDLLYYRKGQIVARRILVLVAH